MLGENQPALSMQRLLQELQNLGSPERAIIHKRYHKSSREHWGVLVPECKKIARHFSKNLSEKERLSLLRALWGTNVFDPMIVAAKLLSLLNIEATEEVWYTLLCFLKSVDGWALEDSLAPIAWKCLLKDESLLDEVEVWTRHPNFWMRRAALVYTLPFAKPGRNPERILDWAASYAKDPEWFIQKAIGWWLRVLGAYDPERVIQFLQHHWTSLKGIARKESTRKLADKWHMQLTISLKTR